jgi:DNA polymerase type B, organellar and viral
MANRPGPSRVVCVDPVSELSVPNPLIDERVETLTEWHAVILDRRDKKLTPVFESWGNTPEQLWAALTDEMSHPGQLWVVSYQCARAWALLGLWAMLESGKIRIAGGDARAVNDPRQYGPKVKPGLLVAEDPPNIAELRIGVGPGKILWIDCRNWGVSVDPALQRGEPVVGDLAALVARLDEMAASNVGAPLSPTAAGAAWRGWRATIKDKGVHCHTNQDALDLERAAHLGGRCECFRLGKLPGRWFHFDFRSAYAAVLCQTALPFRLEKCFRVDDPKAHGIQKDIYRAIASVTIETNEPAYPLMRDGEVIYPVGKFVTTLCGPELKDAYYLGRIKFWHEASLYQMNAVAKRWADGVYRCRVDADAWGDKQLGSYCKAVLNSLPGKLGYRRRCWDVVPGAMAPQPWGTWHQIEPDGGVVRYRAMAGVVQRENTGDYGPDAVPSMAAWINSVARVKLLNMIRLAGWEETAYVDTDCLIVSLKGMHALYESMAVEEGRLGMLELRSSSTDVEICGIKHYIEDDEVKYAGCPRGTYTMHEDGVHQWYTPPACEGSKRGRCMGDTATLKPSFASGPYRHGIVGRNGKVSPHVIGE